MCPTISEAELDNLVAARLTRQALLTRASAPQLFAVVDEGRCAARSANRG